MSNNLQVPLTPRGHSRSASGVTPTFTFGLGFLPSFSFGLPRNISMLNLLSPQKFFHTSNELSKVTASAKKHSRDPSVSSDIFNSLTPPNSSKPNASATSKLLDPVVSKTEKQEVADLSTYLNDDSIDMWSLGNDTSQNLTVNLTSIYEDDLKPSKTCLTPNKLLLGKPAKKPDFKTPRKGSISMMRSTSTPASKKRSGSQANLDTPSKSIASQIETIASPSKKVKKSSEDSEYDLKLNPRSEELDEQLLRSYAKFKVFKKNQVFDASSTLKNTSESKILSRMLYNKTGVLETPQAIAKRLSRLTKFDDGNDSVTNTPLNNLASNKSSSIRSSNSEIDKEIDQLLASTPIHFELSQKRNWAFEPKNFGIEFKYNKPQLPNHCFAMLDQNQFHETTLHEAAFKKKLKFCKSILDEFDKVSSLMTGGKAPIWHFTSKLNMVEKKVPEEHQSYHQYLGPLPLESLQSFNLNKGNFQSYLNIDVPATEAIRNKDMLTWKCTSFVYLDRNLLFNTTDCVNGYRNRDARNFNLHIPFLNKFWSGYLSYLMNGNEDIDQPKKILVMQFLYEDPNGTVQPLAKEKLNLKNIKTLHGCFLYEFNSDGPAGVTKLNSIKLISEEDDDEDDNATVLADSSPYKMMTPHKLAHVNDLEQHVLAPSFNNNLKIDITKANGTVAPGPLSAPVYYNTQRLNKFKSQPAVPTVQPVGLGQMRANSLSNMSVKSSGSPLNHSEPSPFLVNSQISTPSMSQIATSTPAKTQDGVQFPNPALNFNINQMMAMNPALGISPMNPGLQAVNPTINYDTMINQQANAQYFMFLQQQQQQQRQLQATQVNNFPVEPKVSNFTRQQLQSQMMQRINTQRPFIPYPMAEIQGQNFPSQNVDANKENFRPMQIKFEPILGYDPKQATRKNSKVTTYNPDKN